MDRSRSRGGALPGFGLGLGFTLTYLALIVLIPMSTLLLRTASMTWEQFIATVASPRSLAAIRLSFAAAAAAAGINAVFGLLIAWVLERYEFPGRRLVDGLVDLPFALPTAVAGISLATLYAEQGWIGRIAGAAGMKIAFTPAGIVVALVFVGLPFVVRTVQPVLRGLPAEVEGAAASLGAGRLQIFARVILPALAPALATGCTLALARGLGEYGSVIFIAGNLPMRSEIAPLLILIKLEEYDYAAATALALVFLAASFALLLLITHLTRRLRAAAAR
jgi:sulfate transport system permease protein